MTTKCIKPGITATFLHAHFWVVVFLIFSAINGGSGDCVSQDKRPNFVIVMADDLGFGDLSCYGNQRFKTPNLDLLAAKGIRFSDFHSSGTVCSPTRCGLMTGRYQQRAGIPAVVSVKHKHLGLDPKEVTFAELLRESGYRTAMFGKWHLGYKKKYNPVHQGFEKFRGYVSGNVDFFSHIDQSGAFDWWIQDELKDEPGYTTHLITRHAVDFIRQTDDQPFCLYLAHEAPHYPYQGPNDPPERTVGGEFKVQGKNKDIARAYREMVQEMDKGIGEVVAALEEKGLRQNTLIWFFSDNGANARGNNGGLRGFKGSVWEGGHRVPCIANWPGRIKAGQTAKELTITLDVFPTLLSLASMNGKAKKKLVIPRLDGTDLSSILLTPDADRSEFDYRRLFWGSGKQRAMREGPWKLVFNAKGQNSGQNPAQKNKGASLFNLDDDRQEQADLAADHPTKILEMQKAIAAWEKEVGPSVFPSN